MKKYINYYLLLLLVSIFITGCTEKKMPLKEGHFRIIGKTTNLEAGKLIFYRNFEADTVIVANNKFKYEAPIENIKTVFVAVETDTIKGEFYDPTQYSKILYIESKEMNLTVDVKKIQESKLTGSATHADFDKLNNKLVEAKAPFKPVFDKLDALYEDAENNKEAIKEVYKSLEPYYENEKKAKLDFIKSNPESFISLELLDKLQNSIDVDELSALYETLSDSNKNSKMGEILGGNIIALKKTVIGNMAPTFTSTDVDENPLDLSEFKGNYVLLDFWGSWCNPCRLSHPHLRELYSKYSPKGFEIIGLAADDKTQDKWREAIKEDKIGMWKHILVGANSDDPAANFQKLYGISAYPTKILLDSEGKIVYRAIGYDSSSTELDDLLADFYNK